MTSISSSRMSIISSVIERVLAATDDDQESIHSLTIVEVDQMLDRLAVICPLSAPKHRAAVGDINGDPIDKLVSILRRLHSIEAKWFIRLILKDVPSAEMPPTLTLLNRYGQLHKIPFAQSSTEMEVQFIEPVVVEVVGAGFDRAANECHVELRPRYYFKPRTR